jgi:hypothetical protein
LNETSDNGIDIAAVLRRLSRKPTAFRPPVGKDRVGPVSILSANEAKFRERSQRVKIQQKQSCKMNGAPIGGKTCGARPYRRAPPAGRNRATWTRGPRLRSQQRSAFGRSLMLTRPTRPHSRHKRD